MNSRERVMMALSHQEPDRVPVDFGAMRSTGIMAVVYNQLKEHLGHTEGETFVYGLMQQLAEPERWILDLFGADVEQLHRFRPAFGFKVTDKRDGILPDGSACTYPADFNPVKQEDGEVLIEDGIVTTFRPNSSYVYYQVHHPLSGVTDTKDIDKFGGPTVHLAS